MIRSHQPPLYVTSLPASGYDGQEVYLTTGDPGTVEHYRWLASAARWQRVADPHTIGSTRAGTTGTATVSSATATKMSELTGLAAGTYLVTAMFDWLSVPSTGTFASSIYIDGANARELYVGNGTTIGRVGITVVYLGSVTGTIAAYVSRPLGTGSATIGIATQRLDAVRLT